MVERIEDMPAGTIGFRSTGEVTDDDFANVLEPALVEAVASGDIRLLLIPPPGFGASDVKNMSERVNQLTSLGHRSDWKRVAILIDSSWLRRSSSVWTRVVPVPVKVFSPADEAEARAWLLEA